jgi:RHS repeat-associated protein
MTKGYTPQGYEFQAAYDAENRLKSIQYTDGGTSVVHRIEYIYGASGFVGIIKKYDNGTLVNETRMVRDGFLELQERDQNNAITREYVWGMNMGGGIGGLLALKQNGQNYHYLYDGKGNVSAVLDSAQQIVASYRYDTFGKVMAKSGTLDQPFQFSTKRYDSNTGLNYYGYRFYSPALGRWINRDPIAERGGINLYGFVGNNPINWIDPKGKTFQEFEVALKITLSFTGIGIEAGTNWPENWGVYGDTFEVVSGGSSIALAEMMLAGSPSVPVVFPLALAGAGGYQIGSVISRLPLSGMNMNTTDWWADYWWNLLHPKPGPCP